MRQNLLDDLKIIHLRDKSDALGVAEKQTLQLNQKYEVNFTSNQEIKNIIVAGMGGSGWPAWYLRSWPGVKVPFEVVNDYILPHYAGIDSLVIISSFSGNTEETISALDNAKKCGAQIVVMTTGGSLAEQAVSENIPMLKIPSCTQPRMSTFYFLAAQIELLEKLKLIKEGIQSELSKVTDWLNDELNQWTATVPTSKNLAKQLALDMVGKSPVIYAGPTLGPVARKWKICINENAKNIAWWNVLPEFNHNEFIGWSSHPVDKPYCIIDLRSKLDHQRIQKRFEVTEKMLSGIRPATHSVIVHGETILKQLLWASVLGDFVSIYLAILNNVDPTPVDLVEKFKIALDQ